MKIFLLTQVISPDLGIRNKLLETSVVEIVHIPVSTTKPTSNQSINETTLSYAYDGAIVVNSTDFNVIPTIKDSIEDHGYINKSNEIYSRLNSIVTKPKPQDEKVEGENLTIVDNTSIDSSRHNVSFTSSGSRLIPNIISG